MSIVDIPIVELTQDHGELLLNRVGENVEVTMTDEYAFMSGTSMATPHA